MADTSIVAGTLEKPMRAAAPEYRNAFPRAARSAESSAIVLYVHSIGRLQNSLQEAKKVIVLSDQEPQRDKGHNG